MFSESSTDRGQAAHGGGISSAVTIQGRRRRCVRVRGWFRDPWVCVACKERHGSKLEQATMAVSSRLQRKVQKSTTRFRKRGEGKTARIGVLAHRETAGVEGCRRRGRERRVAVEVQYGSMKGKKKFAALGALLARWRGRRGRRCTGDDARLINGGGGAPRRAVDGEPLRSSSPNAGFQRRKERGKEVAARGRKEMGI